MRINGKVVAVMTALNASSISAAAASYCTGPDICFQWGVPEASAKAGSGNVYFQLKAPKSQQWIALGIGSQMQGSDIFIVYQDGAGNVTLSTRLGGNHVMPTYKERRDVELLAGSGIVGDSMVANVKCGSGCSNLDLSGNSNWISAWKVGDPLDSTSPEAIITQHDDTGQFKVNLAAASISSDSNPFLGSNDGGNSDGSSGGNGGNGGNRGNAGNAGSSSGPGGGAVSSADDGGSSTNALTNAHGILMSIIFVCMYPIGSIIMPLFGRWYLHASWQVVAFLGMWVGLVLGCVVANRLNIFFDQAHTSIGVLVVCLLTLQPIFGLIHHIRYRRTQSRGIFSYIHIWYGRTLMVVGIINGGLGLQLGGAANGLVIAYSLVAGVVTVLYLAVLLVRHRRSRGKRMEHMGSPVMAREAL